MKKGFDYPGVSITYFCHDGEGNFLFHKRGKNCRDEHGCWDCGGGGLKFGEKVEEVLKREVKEEYSTDVLEYEFIAYNDVHRIHDSKMTHWVALCFKVLVDKKKVKNGEPDKFDEIGWFRLDNLPDNLHSQLPSFLDKYKNKLIA